MFVLLAWRVGTYLIYTLSISIRFQTVEYQVILLWQCISLKLSVLTRIKCFNFLTIVDFRNTVLQRLKQCKCEMFLDSV